MRLPARADPTVDLDEHHLGGEEDERAARDAADANEPPAAEELGEPSRPGSSGDAVVAESEADAIDADDDGDNAPFSRMVRSGREPRTPDADRASGPQADWTRYDVGSILRVLRTGTKEACRRVLRNCT